MTIQNKRPEYIETVGAQYICFATASENPGDFSGTYESNVEKTETVKKVSVKDNEESTQIHGSGKIYANASQVESSEISVESIAFVRETLLKMRGDNVDAESGFVLSGAAKMKPYFAYGKEVILSNGNFRYDWYPKCQLISNSDEAETSEGKPKEQNESITILALPFDASGNIKSSIESQIGSGKSITAEKFFAKPVLKKEDLSLPASLKER